MLNTRMQPQAGQRPNRAATQNSQIQPMPNMTQGPERMNVNKRVQSPKKSALKKALPYLVAGGSTSAAVGGVWGYLLFS